MRSDFTVLTVAADENISGLLPYMIESVRKFTHPMPNIVVVDNNLNNDEVLAHYRKDPYVSVVTNHRPKEDKSYQSTSFMHGNGLNAGMRRINTPYTAIIESDCVVCNPNWFKFDKKRYDMVCAKKGVKADEEYYHMFFLMFKSSLFKHIDWRPSWKRVDANKQADTGCNTLDNLPAKKRILRLKPIKCKARKAKIFTHPLFHYKSTELWDKNGNVVAAHFGRGSDMTRRQTNINENPDTQCSSWKRIAKRKLGITMPR